MGTSVLSGHVRIVVVRGGAALSVPFEGETGPQ